MIRLLRTFNEKSGAELFSRHKTEIRDYEGSVEAESEEGYFLTLDELRELFDSARIVEGNVTKSYRFDSADKWLESKKKGGDERFSSFQEGGKEMTDEKDKTIGGIVPKRDWGSVTISKEDFDLAKRDDKEIIRVINEKIEKARKALIRSAQEHYFKEMP